MFSLSQRAHLTLVSCVVVPSALAQVTPAAPDLAAEQLRRQQQREELQRKQDEARPDVRLQAPVAAPADGYPTNEAPCFVIRSVELGGDDAARFQWALGAAQPALNRCLGSTGINTMVSARGYVTARVLAPSQDLLTGVLRLTLVPGRVRAVRFTAGQPAGGYGNALPLRPGDLLDLRAIEQGLENFKRDDKG
jgi:hemolysin activation/secretion protein